MARQRRFWMGTALVLSTVLALLAFPAAAMAERPNIERVVVSRTDEGVIAFRIEFAKPVVVDPEDTVQVAIDSDRDSGTGVDGLEYSLDIFGPVSIAPRDGLSLLTAVDGEPVASHPSALRFTREVGEETFGFGSSSMTFSIPTALVGNPRRFDFYAFIRVEGELDEAPSHFLIPPGYLPWTYPKQRAPDVGEAYPVEYYEDGWDITVNERPGLLLGFGAAALVVLGGLLALVGWSIQRFRHREPKGTTLV
jgi:hypothetical protein